MRQDIPLQISALKTSVLHKFQKDIIDVVSGRAQNVAGEPLQYDEPLVKKVAPLSLETVEEKHRWKTHNEVEQAKSRCSSHKSYE